MQTATPFHPRSQTTDSARWHALGAWIQPSLFVASCLLSVWLSVSYFVGAGHDELWLPLWSGERLAETGRLMNHNGDPAEIGSSLLHVLLIAVFHALAPGSALLMSKLSGLLAGVLTLTAIYAERDLLFGALPGRFRSSALTVALFATATHPSWLNWNLGGLETPYQSLLLTLHLLLLLRHTAGLGGARRLALTGSAYALVRPEGIALVGLTALVIVVHATLARTSRGLAMLKRAALPPLVLSAVLALLRLALFGLLAPTPVYAKTGALGDWGARLADGAAYLIDFYRSSPLMLIAAGAVAIGIALLCDYAWRTARRQTHPSEHSFARTLAIGLALLAFNHGFVLLTRGDWMAYYRFVAPAVPVLSIVMALALAQLAARFGGQARALPLIGAACMLAFCAGNFSQNPRGRTSAIPPSSLQRSIADLFDKRHGETLRERVLNLNASYLRDQQTALPFLRDQLPKIYHARGKEKGQLTIAAYQMGFMPYFAKRMHPGLNVRFIDTMGLTDPAIARLGAPGYLWGVRGGERLDLIMTGRMGALSQAALARKPDVLYLVEATDAQRALLEARGWRPVWQKPGAAFFAEDGGRRTADGR